jgi:hypothetical protein
MKVKSESRPGKIVSEEKRADDGNISPSAFLQSSPHQVSLRQCKILYTLKNLIQKILRKKVVTLMESATYYSGLPYPDPKYTSLRYVGGQEGIGDQFLTVLRQNVASHNVYVTKHNCY